MISKKLKPVLIIVIISIISSCKISMLTSGPSDTTFRKATIISSENDTIVGYFKENVNDGIIQQIDEDKTKHISEDNIKSIKFQDEQNTFIKFKEKPLNDSIIDVSNIWLEVIIDNEISLYKKYYLRQTDPFMTMQMERQNMQMQQQMNFRSMGPNPEGYDNISKSTKSSYFYYVIKLNDNYPQVIKKDFFGGSKKGIKKVFHQYPDILNEIDALYKEQKGIKEIVEMLNSEKGKKLLAKVNI